MVYQLAVLGSAALSSSQNASFSVRDDRDLLVGDEVMQRVDTLSSACCEDTCTFPPYFASQAEEHNH